MERSSPLRWSSNLRWRNSISASAAASGVFADSSAASPVSNRDSSPSNHLASREPWRPRPRHRQPPACISPATYRAARPRSTSPDTPAQSAGDFGGFLWTSTFDLARTGSGNYSTKTKRIGTGGIAHRLLDQRSETVARCWRRQRAITYMTTRQTVDREVAKAAIRVLGQPMGRSLHLKLKAIFDSWSSTHDDRCLLTAVALVSDQFSKEKPVVQLQAAFRRESLTLVCFEYVSG